MTMVQNGAIMLTPPHAPEAPPASRRRRTAIWAALGIAVVLALGTVWVGSLAPVRQPELVGAWSSTNGGTLTSVVLRPNGSAHVSNLQAKDRLLSFDGSWAAVDGGVVVETNDAIDGVDWAIKLPTSRSLFQPQLSNYPYIPDSRSGEQQFTRP